jgi:NAD(P)-dependent dehydrogenase (short-subunit alcohol dehydrogenase family)
MNLGLKDQPVLVTGSSSGVGRATAIAFGAEGARVAVTYHRNRIGADDTAQRVRDAGGQALVVQYDLANPDSVRSCVEHVQNEWGAIHVLVNNAAPMNQASPSRQLFEDEPPAEWQAMIRSSQEGMVLTIQCLLPLMRASGWGRIVTVSSITATDGWPGLGAYAMAKAGLHGLSRTLALELGPANILSNVVALGAVMTERNLQQVTPEQQEQINQHTPTRRLVTPDDVAAVIIFLGSQANRQVTGEVIRVTGGQ